MEAGANFNHNSCTFNIKEDRNLPQSKDSKRDIKVIHDSLSKFKLAHQESQTHQY